MKFTKKDISEFKQSKFFPWMGNRIITPTCISFTDYMFGGLWTITKEKADGETVYVLSRKKKRGRKFFEIGNDICITTILISVEFMLWEECIKKTPDLSKIPMSYILDTPERLAMDQIALPFLMTIVPMKMEQDGMEM